MVGSILLFGFPAGSVVKDLPVMQETQETQFRSLGWEDPLEEGPATHSSILASRIPRTEEPGGLQSVGLQSRSRLRQLSVQVNMEDRQTMEIQEQELFWLQDDSRNLGGRS